MKLFMNKITLSLALSLIVANNVDAQFWDITEPVKLPGTVNTATAEESMPVFSKDSSILYFTRTGDASNAGGENDQDIWSSKRESNGDYTNCARVKGVNNNYNNAVLGLSKDGQTMYVLNSYEGKKDMKKGLALSKFKNGTWGEPENIEIPGLDIDGDFYGFHVNSSENVILLSFKGPNTLGQEDLYVSTKNGSTWSTPIHMGNVLNTTGFEISPFLNQGQDTLFFSSNGHGGQGDADIFYAVKKGSWTEWSAPVNLGNKINSSKFDAYFIYSGNQLYWSSNRDADLSDIYMAMIKTPPPVSIVCAGTNVTANGGSDGKVDATVEGGVPPFTYAWSSSSKTEDISGLKIGTYTVTVTDAIGQTATCSSTITEPPAPAFSEITLKHYFDYNADKLTVTEGKLKDFVEQVGTQINGGREKIKISINSSASYVPTKTYETNDKLAKARANKMEKELNKYFESKGMSSKVKVVITSAIVQGPPYDGDYQNTAKYRDYQFIELKTGN